jgi:hypothetical protein
MSDIDNAARKAALKSGDPAEGARHAGAVILLDAATEAARAGDAKRAAHLLALGRGLGYEIGIKRTGGGYLRAIRLCDVAPDLEKDALAEVGKAATAQAGKPKAGGQRVAIGRAKA